MSGKTSLLKYFAAPAGPPTTTSLGSALTMPGAPISAPAADMALVLSSARRDGLHNVIGFAPSQGWCWSDGASAVPDVHISHKHLKICQFSFTRGLREEPFGMVCAHSMLMNVHKLCGGVRL